MPDEQALLLDRRLKDIALKVAQRAEYAQDVGFLMKQLGAMSRRGAAARGVTEAAIKLHASVSKSHEKHKGLWKAELVLLEAAIANWDRVEAEIGDPISTSYGKEAKRG